MSKTDDTRELYEREQLLIDDIAVTIAKASGLGWQDAWDEDDGARFMEVAVEIIKKVRDKDMDEAMRIVLDSIHMPYLRKEDLQ